MNCQECTEQLLPLLENVLDAPAAQIVQDHLAVCPTCRVEFDASKELRERLTRLANVPAHTSVVGAVMDRIANEQVELTRRIKMKRRFHLLSAAALAAILLVSVTLAALYYGPSSATAAEILARGAEAAAHLKSIYIKCRMRTLPQDNFEYIDLNHDFVDVELWKQFGSPVKWRIEKPGRVAVMDGKRTTMIIANRFGTKLDMPTAEAFDTGWLHRLAAIDNMLSHELAAASLPSDKSEVKRSDTPGDPSRQTVVVQVKPNREIGEYLRNKLLSTSETRREYTFDRKSGRLETAKWYCKSGAKDVLALEITEIKYDASIDGSKFELTAPAGIVWDSGPQRLPDNEKYEKMTPSETAQAFFDACSKRDWNEAGKFFPALTDDAKKFLGGLTVIKLGKPFQVWPYAGWFVPYEIRLPDGQVKKFNLALRNDNPAKRFVVDGGI